MCREIEQHFDIIEHYSTIIMAARNTRRSKLNRHNTPKNSSKENKSPVAQDGFESEILGPYQLIFLMESTYNSTRYIDIYKDAINQSNEDLHECRNTFIIDYYQLVNSLDNTCVDGKDDIYKQLHEQNQNFFIKNGKISTKLMVQLVRQSIIIALESIRQKCNNAEEDEDEKVENNPFQSTFVNIVLTNFFDLAFIREFIDTKIKVGAIVEVSCRKIAQIRDRFVSRASRAKRCMADEVIQQFWHDFRNGLNVASMFKDIMVYSYESKYNAHYEPPNSDKIISMSRAYVMREMIKVQNFIFNVGVDFEKYTKSVNPTYSLLVDGDYERSYELYKKNLDVYPQQVLTVPIILDAMMKALESNQCTTKDWVDTFFNGLRDESDDGCMNYPICVQYGNECAQAVKRYDLRHTDYLKSAVSVMNTRWKTLLWASRPRMAFKTEEEYDNIISGIKRQCPADIDVDMQLCVLGLNRLQSNLNVFRGETIGLPGLGVTNVTFKPVLIEPNGCVTMVQMLEKESERRKRMSYAYFEPEDVMLIGFYDFAERVASHKSSFAFATPQRPVYARDYFDYFHGKKTPECFYAMQPRRPDAAYSPCVAYSEQTEELRFRCDDCLTVTKKKWRRERPGTMCLVYKSKRFEIVRNVAGADDDCFRIYTRTGCEHCIFKSNGDAIGYVSRTADGAEIFSESGVAAVRELRQSAPNTKAVAGGLHRSERCRRYECGRVTVEYSDNTAVRYWASGKVTLMNPTVVARAKFSRNSRPMETNGMRNDDSKMRNSITRTSRTSGNSNEEMGNSDEEVNKSNAGMSGKRNSSRKVSKTRNNSGKISKTRNSWQNSVRSARSDGRVTETDGSESLLLAVNHSDDGTTRTVEFADGTRISTYVREVPDEPGWACLVVSGHEYAHPAYRPVTDGRGPDGVPFIGVTDHVRLSADGCEVRLRLSDSERVMANEDGVRLYGLASEHLRDVEVATFAWNNNAAATTACLFERRVGRGDVTTVAYDRDTDDVRVTREAVAAAWTAAADVTPPVQFFVVKRDMSGFALFGREFAEELRRDRTTGHVVAVHESRNGKHVVALFEDGRGCGGRDASPSPIAEADGGYEWLRVRFPATRMDPRDAVPTLLRSRTFTTVSKDTDYGPVATALRDADRSDDVEVTSAVPRRDNGPGPGKLAVRVNVPCAFDSVTAMVCGRECVPPSGASSPRYDRDAIAPDGIPVGLSAKLAARKHDDSLALEARMRMRTNNFIPYFRSECYLPLRDRLPLQIFRNFFSSETKY